MYPRSFIHDKGHDGNLDPTVVASVWRDPKCHVERPGDNGLTLIKQS